MPEVVSSFMPGFVLYHRRSSRPENWDEVGTFRSLEAAQDAAAGHAANPIVKPHAWIMEQRGSTEWRLVAGSEVFKVERLHN
jgi:hypothetical protein